MAMIPKGIRLPLGVQVGTFDKLTLMELVDARDVRFLRHGWHTLNPGDILSLEGRDLPWAGNKVQICFGTLVRLAIVNLTPDAGETLAVLPYDQLNGGLHSLFGGMTEIPVQ